MKKQILEGLEIYELVNEFQIYNGPTLHRVWKSGKMAIDSQRLQIKVAELASI